MENRSLVRASSHGESWSVRGINPIYNTKLNFHKNKTKTKFARAFEQIHFDEIQKNSFILFFDFTTFSKRLPGSAETIARVKNTPNHHLSSHWKCSCTTWQIVGFQNLGMLDVWFLSWPFALAPVHMWTFSCLVWWICLIYKFSEKPKTKFTRSPTQIFTNFSQKNFISAVWINLK